VDSAALMENAARLPQGLDNCFAVTHTDHSPTTTKAFFFFMGKKRMTLKTVYQQIVIVVDRDELAKMLLAQPGFEIEKIEDKQNEVHFIFGRKDDCNMSLPLFSREEEQKLFSLQEELRHARRL
jgi:hypothetical protein